MPTPAGVNSFTAIVPLPPNVGDGPILDVSALTARKTIYLAGAFSGLYEVLGTHNDANWVPICKFWGGEGPQSVQVNVKQTLKSIRVRRQAALPVTISIAAQTVLPCP